MDPNHISGLVLTGEYKMVLTVGDQKITHYASILKDH